MNPFTTNAALRVLGLPRLCPSQFADLAGHPEDEAFMAALLELAFQARVREARYEQSLRIAHELAHEWTEADEAYWRTPLPDVDLPGADPARRAAIDEVRHARSHLASVRWLAALIDGLARRTACTDSAIAREQAPLARDAISAGIPGEHLS
jgi:hypothetical protein